MEINEPGIYAGFPIDFYHRDPAPEPSLSSSTGRVLIDESPMHFAAIHPRLQGAEQSEEYDSARAIGTAVHKLILGRGATVEVFEYDDWRKNEAKAARADCIARGHVPLLAKHMERASETARAIRDQLGTWTPEQADGVDAIGMDGYGEAEVACFVRTPAGIWLRSLVDWRAVDGHGDVTITDLKTTRTSAEPHAVASLVSGQDWSFQAAFYERVETLLDPKSAGRVRVRFLVAEQDPPHGITGVYLTEAEMDAGRHRVAAAEALFERCLRSGEWPSYPPGFHPVVLKPWAQQAWHERVAEAEADPSGATDWMLARRAFD